jgi:hypothetical protein
MLFKKKRQGPGIQKWREGNKFLSYEDTDDGANGVGFLNDDLIRVMRQLNRQQAEQRGTN